MSLQQRAIGKSIVVKLDGFAFMEQALLGITKDDEKFLDEITTIDMNTKVWFEFNLKKREVWMEVAI